MARKPRSKARSGFNLKTFGIVIAVAAVLTPLAVLGGRAVFVTRSEFERLIQEAGFYPLSPPSNLVMPGSIYQVSKDGRFYTTICRANAADVLSATQESKTQDVVASSLQGGTFDLDAKAAEAVNARLNGNLVRAVQFTLRDVAVIEIPVDRNEEIFVKLTSQKPCHDAVRRLLERGDLVCQGQSVLRATVEYRLVTAGSAEAVAELIGTAIKSALEGALKTSLVYDDGRLVSGVNLHYGVKVNPICVTLPTDEMPRTLPPVRSAQVAMLAP
ncbi:MAG TPA: hypothetical protein VFK86_18295 [Bauldia sp.]|nr:hypothetical protein [Bauldia sp.]